VVPGNITLLELPPYSPELNPVERIWHYLRSHWLANSVFTSLARAAASGCPCSMPLSPACRSTLIFI
jgi:transposase